MNGRNKNQDSVRGARSLALVAGVIACTLCLPNEVRGQNNGSAITCSSNNGKRVYCSADTRGGVRMVRQISGSSCQEGSSWGYDARGIWVDRGCRAEFAVAGAGYGNSGNSGSGSTITCSSDNGQRVYCNTGTQGGVRMVRQISGSPCQEGSTWGYDARGIWVDRGCRAEFSVAGGGYGGNPGGGYSGSARTIGTGTSISVRTNETIDVRKNDGRVFTGVVDQDVVDASGNVAIPRGSGAELIVKDTSNREMALDLESVTVNGQRFAIAASPESISSSQRDGLGKNKRTAEFVGGGALLGTIVGAIAGGGKGAAIGAAAGAGAGAGTQVLTRGRSVRVPAESLLTFRLDQPLQMGASDRGFTRRGRHYHRRNR